MSALARALNALVMRTGKAAPQRLLWTIRHSLRQRGLRPVFEIRLEATGGSDVRAAVEAEIRARLAARYPPLWAKTQQQLCDIAVSIVPPGSLRTGRKIRRLVDERGA